PRHDRGGSGGEGRLEEEERRRQEPAVGRRALHSGYPEPEPEPPAEHFRATEPYGIADERERQDTGGTVHQVLHDDVADVLRPSEPRLHEGESALHREDEDAGDHHPEVVDQPLGRSGYFLLSRCGTRHEDRRGDG